MVLFFFFKKSHLGDSWASICLVRKFSGTVLEFHGAVFEEVDPGNSPVVDDG